MVVEEIFKIILLVLFMVVGAGVILFLLTYMKSHRLVVRSPNSNRILGYYWIIPKIDKESKVVWWQSVFFQKKIKLPAPPDKVVKVNPKGKSWVEVYRLSEDEYIYIVDKGLKKKDILEIDKKKTIESLKPFSEVQRQTVVSQFAKAEAMRKHNWLKENAMNIAALTVMMIIIVVGIVYWGDIAKYTLQKDSASLSFIQEAKQLADGLKTGAVDIAPSSSTGGIVQEGTEEPPTE